MAITKVGRGPRGRLGRPWLREPFPGHLGSSDAPVEKGPIGVWTVGAHG